ncbi:MAG TPA: IS21 family transposase [Chloroflexota bacterium]|nr:IS21 family transposase [Chloroflexota bacterium]
MADVKEILVQWDAGQGVSAIARALGYSRPTVRKYVYVAARLGLVRGERRRGEAAWEELARAVVAHVAQRRPLGAVAADVAAFEGYLAERVGAVRLTVLHQRLRDEHGLAASYPTFYRYCRARWPERMRSAPRVTVRLDDPPAGEEAQVDFFYVGRWFDPDAGRTRKLYAFLMTLSHSRHAFLYPVLAEDAASWLEGHVAAFAFFGAAPRRLVPDNLSAGIRKADRYDPRLNRAYGELTRYYGCLVDPSRIGRPTDKPRVERNVDDARESFFRGRDFASLRAMRAEAERWSREVAGQRVHGTTGERPLVAFETRERAALLALPPRPWEAVVWTSAKVHPDCHLQAGGARYSVPYRYVGRRLEVRLGRDTAEVYDGAALVASHVRRYQGRATKEEHYPAAALAFLRATPQACRARARGVGAATGALVTALLTEHALHHLREVQALLRLADRHGGARLERACRRALEAGDGRYRTVRGLLEREMEDAPAEESAAPSTAGAFLRGPEALLADAAVRP